MLTLHCLGLCKKHMTSSNDKDDMMMHGIVFTKCPKLATLQPILFEAVLGKDPAQPESPSI